MGALGHAFHRIARAESKLNGAAAHRKVVVLREKAILLLPSLRKFSLRWFDRNTAYNSCASEWADIVRFVPRVQAQGRDGRRTQGS